MKILILGATGQIGHALTKALSATGNQISVMVRSAPGLAFPKNVKVLEYKEFTPAAFRAAMQDVDRVIYCIGLPEQFTFNNSIFEQVNCRLLEAFLAELRTTGIRDLTYISTYEVFEVVNGIIVESPRVADESTMTPYFQSMIRAYRFVVDFAKENAINLTTIHPAAVFGGLNTGGGITDYMENLISKRWWKAPFISAGRFPVVHVDSLTDAIVRSLGMPGAYIVSDQMTTLREIARTMRGQAPCHVPLSLPLRLITLGISVLETIASVIRVKPVASMVQIEFITKGWEPNPSKAVTELRWKPMPLEAGIRRYLSTKRRVQGARSDLRQSQTLAKECAS
jgi:nucleoside-diphosphate-sugar epimerase